MPNNISWLGNPVVSGSAPRGMARTPAPHQSYQNQDQQEDFSGESMQARPARSTMARYDPIVEDLQEQASSGPLPAGISSVQGPPPISDPGYVPFYLKKNIGKNVRAEFAIGGTLFVDKVGKLIEVGVNYFVLQDINSRTNIMCDLYSVKFVTILQ